jgi:hypothetical protein
VEPPRVAPMSTFESLDLSAYHEGPFRASLQRYVDLDRIRSRFNRSESMANNIRSTSASRPSFPRPHPPPRFDSDDDPSSAGNPSSRTINNARQVRMLSILCYTDVLNIFVASLHRFPRLMTKILIFLIWYGKRDWVEA